MTSELMKLVNGKVILSNSELFSILNSELMCWIIKRLLEKLIK